MTKQTLLILPALIITSLLISCRGGSGKNDDETSDDITCACCGANQEPYQKLKGTWILDSISQNEKPLVEPLTDVLTLTFEINSEECENNTYSISGGGYLFETASDQPFAFVENTDFLRIQLKERVVRLETIDEEILVFSFSFDDPNDRVMRSGRYLLFFKKQN